MNTRKYYAVQYHSGRHTTTGEPNTRTGRYSIAATLDAFSTKAARDLWVEKGRITSDMRGNCREAVTKKELRALNLGMSVAEFESRIDMVLDLHDDE